MLTKEYVLYTCLCLRACARARVPPTPSPRWINGADYPGDHGRAAQVAPGDEGLHRQLRPRGSSRQPGRARLCAVGGGQVRPQ